MRTARVEMLGPVANRGRAYGAARDGLSEGAAATDIAELVALWLHTVAFVIAWGYYAILGRIVLPGLETGSAPSSASAALCWG
jgi:hypothetical protein